MNRISSTESNQHEYDYSPTDGPPPTYDSSLEYINLPEHRYGSLSGISHEIDGWIAGRTPYCYLNSCEQVYHLTNTAIRHRTKLTQVPSIIEAIKNASRSHQPLRVVGLMSLPAAIVHDVVAPPYHLAQMAIAVSRRKVERKRAEAGILVEIKESLWLSLEAVMRMVMRLGLETHDAAERQIQNGGGYMFLTLARLLEAYRSRFAPSGTVFLASHKRLPKEHCSGTARQHYEQIHNLKDVLTSVNFFPTQDLDTSAVFERCIRRVFPFLKEPFMDSNEEPGFSDIVQRLRHVQDEMPELMSF